jgi:hypothetical protein
MKQNACLIDEVKLPGGTVRSRGLLVNVAADRSIGGRDRETQPQHS